MRPLHRAAALAVAIVSIAAIMAVMPSRAYATVASDYAATVLADQPSSYYKLDDTGSSFVDSSGNGHTATAYGSGYASTASGAFASSSALATTSAGMTIVDPHSVTNPTTYTLEVWFKTTSTTGGRLVGLGDGTGGSYSSNFDRIVWIDNAGIVRFGIYNGTGNVIISSNRSMNDGTWHLATATQGPAGMRLYVDGAFYASNPATNPENTTGTWRIGADNMGGWPGRPTDLALTGAIDDVAIWDTTALTSAQVQAHYVASARALATTSSAYPSAVNADHPDVYYRLDDPNAASIVDSSGNGHNGTTLGPSVGTTRGAILNDPSAAVNVHNDNWTVLGSQDVTNPTTFSVELWLQTDTTTGGRLFGFGDGLTTRPSGNYDRLLYMSDSGQLNFGTYYYSTSVLQSPLSYNDGAWHHVIATMDSTGMKLYVDHRLVASNTINMPQNFTGHWILGADQLGGWPNSPTHQYFTGAIDEVAAWNNVALTQAQIDAHYFAASSIASAAAPVAFSATVAPIITFSVNGRASACNGEPGNIPTASSDVAVNLSHIAAGTVASSAQNVSITSNAGAGAAVYLRGAAANGNFGAPAHTWLDTPGTRAAPAALAGEAFGYTFKDVTAGSTITSPSPNTFIQLDNSGTNAVVALPGTGTGTGCVAYVAQASFATPAATYSGTVIYSAVPTF